MRPFTKNFAVLALAVALLWGCQTRPGISEVEPNSGNVAGNDDVMIKGGGFEPGMTVQFGNRAVGNVIVDSPTRIRVKTPPGAEGQVDVIITTSTGKTYGLRNGFTYRKEG